MICLIGRESDRFMRHSALLSSALACALLAGCGGGGEEAPTNRLPVYPVSGTVKFNGQPVAGADVTFVSTDKDKSAFGRTDEQGNFQLTTYSANDGAVEGKHTVVVVKGAPAAPTNQIEPEDPRYDPIAITRIPPPKPKSEFPEKYSDPKKSDLIAVVNPDNTNTGMVLELKK